MSAVHVQHGPFVEEERELGEIGRHIPCARESGQHERGGGGREVRRADEVVFLNRGEKHLHRVRNALRPLSVVFMSPVAEVLPLSIDPLRVRGLACVLHIDTVLALVVLDHQRLVRHRDAVRVQRELERRIGIGARLPRKEAVARDKCAVAHVQRDGRLVHKRNLSGNACPNGRDMRNRRARRVEHAVDGGQVDCRSVLHHQRRANIPCDIRSVNGKVRRDAVLLPVR